MLHFSVLTVIFDGSQSKLKLMPLPFFKSFSYLQNYVDNQQFSQLTIVNIKSSASSKQSFSDAGLLIKTLNQ